MTCLVESNGMLFFLCHYLCFLFQTADYSVNSVKEILHFYCMFVITRCN